MHHWCEHGLYHLLLAAYGCNAGVYAHIQVGLSERINAAGGQVPKKVIEAPFVQIPLGVTEDRLVGTVDIEASMKVYILFTCIQAAPPPPPKFSPAAAHATLLYMPCKSIRQHKALGQRDRAICLRGGHPPCIANQLAPLTGLMYVCFHQHSKQRVHSRCRHRGWTGFSPDLCVLKCSVNHA